MTGVSTRDPAVKNAQETRHAKKWTMTTNAVVETASLTKIVVLALRARKPITFKNVAKCAVKFAPEAQFANSNLESGGVLASMGRNTPMASVSTRDNAMKSVGEARHAKKWTMTSSASARSGMSTPTVGVCQVKEIVMETASLTKIVVLTQHACKWVKM